jgi:PIN domain
VLVSPMPGVDGKGLCTVLRDLYAGVLDARDAASNPVCAYFEWVGDALRSLQTQVSAADIDRLVLTRRYELLLSAAAGSSSWDAETGASVEQGLLDAELDARVTAFAQACDALERQIECWSRPGVFVVVDTSVYITHPHKLEQIDFAPLIGVRGEPIHILVPIVIVDELDGLKQQGRDAVRWRAGYTLAVLDRVCKGSAQEGRLREEDFSALGSGGIPRGEVTVELLFDQPGHVRLPINDDEIIDRALATRPLAGRPVTLLTYDTGQSTRARAAGLRVIKLARPIGDEPT